MAETDYHRSLLFRVVKYILVATYLLDLVLFTIIVITASVRYTSANQYDQDNIGSKVEDFVESMEGYDRTNEHIFNLCLLIGGIVLDLIVIYFLYAAYTESLRQNTIIAIITTLYTIHSIFFSQYSALAVKLYLIWSTVFMFSYVYLIQSENEREQENEHGMELGTNVKAADV